MQQFKRNIHHLVHQKNQLYGRCNNSKYFEFHKLVIFKRENDCDLRIN
jgi:hypothetical protein